MSLRQLGSTELKRLHRQWRQTEPRRLAILLEGLGGPYNLGSILRTAAAYRVEHIYLAAMQIDPGSTNVGKTALGADRYVTWSAHETWAHAADAARKAGTTIVGLELAEGAEPMHTAELPHALCLAVGHEDRGLSKTALADLDAAVYLPQLGRIGSLNVATATSIALWEARRRGFEDQ